MLLRGYYFLLQEVVDSYASMVKEMFLETVDVTAADVTALLAFREEQQIDFEVGV